MNADDLAKILDELGRRLGPTGEYVFQLAVRQVIISSALGAAVSAIGLIALAIAIAAGLRLTVSRYRVVAKSYAEGKGRWSSIGQTSPDWDDYVFPWIFIGLFGGAAMFMLTGIFTSSLIRLLNPEFAALHDLIGMIR